MLNVHLEILAAIDRIRAQHDACTAGEIARITRRHKTGVSRELYRMKDLGLVTFTKMQGSIRRVHAGEPTPIDDDTPTGQVAERIGLHSMTVDGKSIDCTCPLGRDHSHEQYEAALRAFSVPSATVTPAVAEQPAKPQRAAKKAAPADGKKPRTPAQIAATERMRAAQAAKKS